MLKLTTRMAGLPDPFLGKTTQSVVQIFGLISSFYLVEKVGRRKLVLIAGGILALFNFAIGGVGFAQNSSAVGSGLITLFCVWTFVYATSLAPIGKPFYLPREVVTMLISRLGRRCRGVQSAIEGKDRCARHYPAIPLRHRLCTSHPSRLDTACFDQR